MAKPLNIPGASAEDRQLAGDLLQLALDRQYQVCRDLMDRMRTAELNVEAASAIMAVALTQMLGELMAANIPREKHTHIIVRLAEIIRNCRCRK